MIFWFIHILRTSALGDEKKPFSYEALMYHSKVLEERIKPYLEDALSRKYTLTGVDNIEELKSRIENCKTDRAYRYSSGWVDPATSIMTWIKPEEVGTLP